MKAMLASTQSFQNATPIRTISVVASRIIDAVAWVRAWRTRRVSLVTREMSVPVGWRPKKDRDRDCRWAFSVLRRSSTMCWPTYSIR